MIPAPFITPFALLLVVAGVLACFAGYAMFRTVLTLFGFALGALIGSSVVAAGDTVALVVAAVVGGAIGAVVLNLAYFVGVALVGAAMGVVALHATWRFVATGDPHVLIVVAAAVVGALVAAQLQRYVIVLGTAFAGAWTILVGALALAGDKAARAAAAASDVWVAYPLQPAPERQWVLWGWLALGALGTAVQLKGKSKGKVKTAKKVAPRTAPRGARN